MNPLLDFESEDPLLYLKLDELAITMNFESVVPNDVQFRVVDHRTLLLRVEDIIDSLSRNEGLSNSTIDIPFENHLTLTILDKIFQPVEITLEDLSNFVNREIDTLITRVEYPLDLSDYIPLLKKYIGYEYGTEISKEEEFSKYSGGEFIIRSILEENPQLYKMILHKSLANCVSARYIWALKASKKIANLITGGSALTRDSAEVIASSMINGSQMNLPFPGRIISMSIAAGPQILSKIIGEEMQIERSNDGLRT